MQRPLHRRKRSGSMRCSFLSYRTVRLFGTVLLLAFTMLSACAGRVAPSASLANTAPAPAPVPVPAPAPAPAPALVPDQVYRETGTAVWYGKELHGKKTASGEVFDSNGLSAAHRTLPLGTVIRVTNLDNLKSINVRINNRGPFIKNRFLELSYGAARELGFAAQGTARVRIEALDAVRDTGQYSVQAAAFVEEENARMLKERLNKKFEMVTIVPYETNIALFYSVRVGAYASEVRAEQVAAKLTLEGLEPIVVRKD
jgi:rare lipoprotein A